LSQSWFGIRKGVRREFILLQNILMVLGSLILTHGDCRKHKPNIVVVVVVVLSYHSVLAHKPYSLRQWFCIENILLQRSLKLSLN